MLSKWENFVLLQKIGRYSKARQPREEGFDGFCQKEEGM